MIVEAKYGYQDLCAIHTTSALQPSSSQCVNLLGMMVPPRGEPMYYKSYSFFKIQCTMCAHMNIYINTAVVLEVL